MRMEAKVYLSHTDLARVQEAAKRAGESVSSFMRRVALVEADRLAVPQFTSLMDGQKSFAGLDVIVPVGGK